MKSGEKVYIVAKWISIIGLSPILYLFFGTLLLIMLDSFVFKLTGETLDFLVNDYQFTFKSLTGIGFFVFLYLIVRRELKKTTMVMSQVNGKFLFGVFLIYVGHLGLSSFYALLIYGAIKGGGSISGIFLIPMILWMLFFYLIGFSIVNNQRLYEYMRKQNDIG